MLRSLTVEQIGIIDRAHVEFGPGFTAVTGETGAGKSLFIDAIGLALGGRADSDLVRSGAARAVVTLVAEVADARVAMALREAGIEPSDAFTVRRELSADGRSSVRVDGRPVSVGTLRAIGARLVDMHGQHAHQALLAEERQAEFLDEWIGPEATVSKAEVSAAHAAWESARRALSAARSGQREREQRLDLLRFQVGEISEAGLRLGESEELTGRIERLKHAERLREGAALALERLTGGESPAGDSVAVSAREVRGLAEIDPGLLEAAGLLGDANAALADAARELRGYLDGLEADPGALEEAAARLDHLKRLFRKYGEPETAVLAHLAEAEAELAAIENADLDEATLLGRLEDAQARLDRATASLTAPRRPAAQEFSSLVTQEVRELAMERAEFMVRVEPKPVGPDGADHVVFDFTANAGEPPRPLAKVASGGEASRVMLAIKVASAGRAGVPTLVFDEADAGLSGRAAAVVARKLQVLGRERQVVAITHLPQIAARADRHVRIEKSTIGGRTVTDVRPLDPSEREHEVARLLAGEEVTPSALDNARALLSAADPAQPFEAAESAPEVL
jgi:DNA repair protein RecN (Recombination protein N)